jgi:hypothetical protein
MGGDEIIYRPLLIGEWERLKIAYEACGASQPFPLPDPKQSVVEIAERGGRLIGCGGAERTWHVSPFFVDLEFRGSEVARELATRLERHNTERLAEVLVTTNRHVELLAHRMGFKPIPGVIWRAAREGQGR